MTLAEWMMFAAGTSRVMRTAGASSDQLGIDPRQVVEDDVAIRHCMDKQEQFKRLAFFGAPARVAGALLHSKIQAN